MDFQSRINQFRQGLSDQQSSYNSMAANLSQFGRSAIPDKVAKHLAYTEQVGGIITGASAGVQGAKKLAKRLMKARAEKLAKNSPKGKSKAEGEEGNQSQETTGQEAQGQQGKAQSDQASDDTKGLGPNEEGDPSTAFQEGKSAAGAGDVKEGTGLKDDDAEDADAGGGGSGGGSGGGPAEPDPVDTRPPPARAAQEPSKPIQGTPEEQATDDSGDSFANRLFGKGKQRATQPDPEDDSDLFNESLQGKGGAQVRPTESGGQSGGQSGGSSGGSSGGDDLAAGPAAQEEADEGSGFISRATGALGDLKDTVSQGIKDTVGKVGAKIGEKVGLDITAEGVADTIPVIGELVGLGMLIHGIVKAHKHEENAGPPQLTAAKLMPTEQSGGFSTDMLKVGSMGAPEIT